MWLILAGVLCIVVACLAWLLFGRGAPVEMPGGETILIPTRPTNRARRRWRITIERS